MRTTAAEHRARQRRVLAWSLMSAVVIHLGVFVFLVFQGAETGVPAPDGESSAADAMPQALLFLEVTFGPPTISSTDGEPWTEPPDRRLEAEHVTSLPPGCDGMVRGDRTRFTGDVRLRVRDSGFVDAMELTRSTGDPCGDEVLSSVAGSLHYHWLPDERFHAPIDLVQPVTIGVLRKERAVP